MTQQLVSMSSPDVRHSVLRTAKTAVAAGISVVPIRNDGTKQPFVATWLEYQDRYATERQVDGWFGSEYPGLAFITGSISGNLEAIDFDDDHTFRAWRDCIRQDRELAALYHYVSWGYLEVTPSGGRHLLYRCHSPIDGNQKLASRPLDGHGNSRKTLIETRGQGGLIIVSPSRGKVHRSGKPYVLQLGGVASIRTITASQRRLLLDSARRFDEMPAIQPRTPQPTKTPRLENQFPEKSRPGDLFNQLASWDEVLTPHGWRLLYERSGEGYWTKNQYCHATTNYRGSDLLYVFSTATRFDPECGYSKFAAYTLLNYGSTTQEAFREAAKALAEQGYAPK
jgi:Bifunctional DNA primase/polymerase, N-terminal